MLDEGIYLDGASRVARGQAPYHDFFTFTGPTDPRRSDRHGRDRKHWSKPV